MSCTLCYVMYYFFFFNDTATTEIYTLSLHDALPISMSLCWSSMASRVSLKGTHKSPATPKNPTSRSEEHTSELQSLAYLVCRLLLEKKKKRQRRLVTHMTSQKQAQSEN